MTEHLEEQASLYVLDLLETEEKRGFLRALEGDAELARLVQDLSTALTATVTPLPPPPDLKARIMAAARQRRSPKIIPFPLSNVVPWALAACLALAFTGLFWQNRVLQDQIACLQAAVSGPDQWEVASLRTVSERWTQASATVLWNPSLREGKLTVKDLPPCEAGKDYQLWIICPVTKNPVPAGLVRVDAQGEAVIRFQPQGKFVHAERFAISQEKAGGSTHPSGPEGPIVLAGTLL